MISKQDCFDILKEISEFKENWNGYGADSFSKELVTICKYAVPFLNHIDWVAPTANNSIQFEASLNKVYIELEIDLRNCTFFISNVHGNSVTFKVSDVVGAIMVWNTLISLVKSL